MEVHALADVCAMESVVVATKEMRRQQYAMQGAARHMPAVDGARDVAVRGSSNER